MHIRYRIWVFACLILAGLGSAQAQLYLNEVMASNSLVIADNAGEFDDWIEIYNAGSTVIDLANYSLSDDTLNPLKSILPTAFPILTSVPPGGYLLLWADNEPLQGANHLNFKLSASGELIRLYDPTGALVDEIDFEVQSNNIAFGRITDANPNFAYLGMPTPLASNGTLAAETQAISDLTINEVMSMHDTTIVDAFGEREDWIELHYAGISAIDIGGVFLTDDKDDLTKWQLSNSLSVPPGGYVQFWADDDPEQGTLHTDFKLDNEGEWIALVQRIGESITILDSISIPALPENISYGRVVDGVGEFEPLLHFSPAASNVVGTPIVRLPEISLKSGRYSGAQTVSLSCATAGVDIYYSTDGSEPSQADALYSAPLSISQHSSLRVRAYKSAYEASPVATASYMIDDGHSLPVLMLTTDPHNLFSGSSGIYVAGTNGILAYCEDNPGSHQPKNYNQEWERPAHVSLMMPNGDLPIDHDIGIKIGGNCSRRFALKSLTFFFRDSYSTAGDNEVQYQLFPNKEIDRFKRLYLRNAGAGFQSNMLDDAMIATWTENQMNLDSQGFLPTVVYFNGQYWGIMCIREKFDRFRFGYEDQDVNNDSIDIVRNPGRLDGGREEAQQRATQGDTLAYSALKAYLKTHDVNQDSVYEYLMSQIDFDNMIDFYMNGIYIAQKDWISNNVKIWQERTEGGKWRFCTFDLESGFRTANHNTLQRSMNINNALGKNRDAAIFFRTLMQQRVDFRAEALQRQATYMELVYDSGRFADIADSIKALVDSEIPAHVSRWQSSGGFSQNTYNNSFNSRKNFVNSRKPELRTDWVNYFNLSGTYQLSIPHDENSYGNVEFHSNGYEVPYNYTGQYYQGLPIKVVAVPQEGSVFSHWLESGSTQDTIEFVSTKDTTLTPIFIPGPKITEIHYHPIDNPDAEFIEIYNPHTVAYDLHNYRLSEGVEKTFPPISIPAKGYILIAKDSTLFTGLGVPVLQWQNGSLSNSGENVRLLTPNGVLQDEVDYNDKFPWPEAADGEGGSLMLIAPYLDNNEPQNWKTCCGAITPGQDNEVIRHPGGGAPNLSLWLKGDPATIERDAGGSVRRWRDQSGLGNDATQVETSHQAKFLDTQINGYGGLYFDGANDWMKLNALASTLSDSSTIFVVIRPETDSDDGYYLSSHLGGSNRVKFGTRANGELIFDDDSPSLSSDIYDQKPVFISMKHYPNDSVAAWVEGQKVNSWVGFSSSGADRVSLGQEFDGSGGDGETSNHWRGLLAELIVYKGVLEQGEMDSIQSYLSIKYGLDLAVAAHQFYQNAEFGHDLVGLAKAESTLCFNHMASCNQNDDAILRLENPRDLDENEYLIIGHNGLSADASHLSPDAPATFGQRARRIWFVEADSLGTLDLGFVLEGRGFNLTDPRHWGLIMASDTNFVNASIAGAWPVLEEDTLWFRGVELTDSSYFALAYRPDFSLLQAKAILGGAWQTVSNLMRDDLRAASLLPQIDPYLQKQKVDPLIWSTTGSDAIVDWVLIDIRSENDSAQLLHQQAALLQRDGDIVDFDGKTALVLPYSGTLNYFIGLHHRNHLSVMTATALASIDETYSIDFSLGIAYGLHGQKLLSNGQSALWSGDLNADGQIVFQGADNDPSRLFIKVLTDPMNATFARNYVINAYLDEDVNLDGQVIFQGGSSDTSPIFINVLSHPLNAAFARNFIFSAQMP
ncbi:MAG: lamin tail domain-containing protein [Bacteroidia bacterium]